MPLPALYERHGLETHNMAFQCLSLLYRRKNELEPNPAFYPFGNDIFHTTANTIRLRGSGELNGQLKNIIELRFALVGDENSLGADIEGGDVV